MNIKTYVILFFLSLSGMAQANQEKILYTCFGTDVETVRPVSAKVYEIQLEEKAEKTIVIESFVGLDPNKSDYTLAIQAVDSIEKEKSTVTYKTNNMILKVDENKLQDEIGAYFSSYIEVVTGSLSPKFKDFLKCR